MNLSQTVALLKSIESNNSTSNTNTDNIYLGVSRSNGLLNTIDSSLSTIDTSLNNIEADANTLATAVSASEMAVNITSLTAFTTGIGNAGAGTINVAIAADDSVSTNIGNIHTRLSAIETNTNNQDTNLTSIDTSLNNIETNTSNANTTLYTIDTSLNNIKSDIDNLNDNRKLNFSTQYENLQWSGSSNSLSSGDYSSTTGKAWWQNTTGDDVIITKITVGFESSETTWALNKIFTSTASAGSSWIRWGTSNDTTGIDTEIIKFNHNGEMTGFLTYKLNDFYGWVIENLNILVSNNEYFMCEFSGTINAAGDGEVWSGIFVDVKQS